jgi:hypothetical protein
MSFSPSPVHTDIPFKSLPNGAIFFARPSAGVYFGPLVKSGSTTYITPNVWPVAKTQVNSSNTTMPNITTRVLQVTKNMVMSQRLVE